MAVRVQSPSTDGISRTETMHETADEVDVKDGHLFVSGWIDGGQQNVAVYAPSKWIRAVVEPDAAK